MGTHLHHEGLLQAARPPVADVELPADLALAFIVQVDERGPGLRTQSVQRQVVADFCRTGGE